MLGEGQAAVVLVAGTSPGLLWELEQVMRRVARRRVILIVPAWPGHDRAAFQALARQRLGLHLPALNAALYGPLPHDIPAP